MDSNDRTWKPEGGELVAPPMLVEIDELVGKPEIDLRPVSELDQRITVLSGHVAISTEGSRDIVTELTRLVSQRTSPDDEGATIDLTVLGDDV